ncbi:unnamed protein product [Acanthoscelides obtectus]|uniref:Endonuclease/exonuclease/phosphatase domain-containing protein n=1 Tax=Acanthoscelides obtectus TaxID=200917 RepID=A0A9P0L2G1_ACAOB|nr:unnamed protein product [Acanthoscelides obtectus]CAK1639383.1 hypothetical protein AOBTE_LOCUS11154 [Acanthoscelides obtectus]
MAIRAAPASTVEDIVSLLQRKFPARSFVVSKLPRWKNGFTDSFKNSAYIIFTKPGIKIKQLFYVEESSVEGHIESSGIIAGTETNKVKYSIICLYCPPSGDINIFLEGLTAILNTAADTSEKIILCGNLNIDSSKTTPSSMFLEDILSSFNLLNCTIGPTRISVNKNNQISSTTIDKEQYINYLVNESRHLQEHHELIIASIVDNEIITSVSKIKKRIEKTDRKIS